MIKARMESSVGNRDSYYGQGKKPTQALKLHLVQNEGLKKITRLEDEQN